jgi:hypothetical protein
MPTVPQDDKPESARVDHLVDEQGVPIAVPEDSPVRPADAAEAAVAGTGPTNWWLYGLVGLAIVIAFLFILQIFSGAPSTDVVEGTPTSEPVTEQVQEAEPSPIGG